MIEISLVIIVLVIAISWEYVYNEELRKSIEQNSQQEESDEQEK